MSGLPEWVSRYIGIPYVAGGRTREGIDCYGLVKLVLAEVFGRETPEYQETLRESASGLQRARWFGEAVASYQWERVQGVGRGIKLPECGDVVLLNRGGLPIHCGLFVGGAQMLHCAEGHNSCVERIEPPKWMAGNVGYFRLRNLA